MVSLKVRKPHVFNVHTQMYRSMFAGVHSIERWADVKDKNLSDSRVARKHYVRDKTEKRRRNLQRLRGRARRREAELLRRRGEGQLVPQYTAAAQVHHKLPHFMRTQEFVDTHRPHWPFVDADFSASEDSEEESEREPDGTSAEIILQSSDDDDDNEQHGNARLEAESSDSDENSASEDDGDNTI